VTVNVTSRQAQASLKSRRGVRARVVEEGEMTIEWQRGPLGTWVTLVGDADVMTIYWEADGTITMSPARGRARSVLTDGAGERVRRKTFRAFLHVAERALTARHRNDPPKVTRPQDTPAQRARRGADLSTAVD
jgi:hypothetical protein